jgi:hypothetical protein
MAESRRQATAKRWIAVAGIAVGIGIPSVGCGNDDSVSPEQAKQQAQAAAQQAVQQERQRQQQHEQSQTLDDLKKQVASLVQQLNEQQASGGAPAPAAPPAASGVPSDATSCGAGIYVNSNTSCPFAVNVLTAYLNAPGNTFTAHSPTTGSDYTMTCSGASPITCTGGNDAAVYIVF